MNPAEAAPMAARAAGETWRLRAVAAVAVTFAAVATFPPPSRPPSPTLDGSWVGELNRLAQLGSGFGRNAAFTYGPLGYLLFPMDLGTHLLQAAILRLLVVAALAGLAFRGLRRVADHRATALFLGSQLAAGALGLTFEYQLLLPVQLLCAFALEAGAPGALALAGAAGGALLFAKTSAGLAALASLAAVLAAWVTWQRPRALAAVLVSVGATSAVTLLLAATYFPSVREIGPWLLATWRIAGDYSVAMSWSGPPADVAVAAPTMMAAVAATGWLWWLRLPGAAVALASVGPLFLAFKHAFVRQDHQHVGLFFPYLIACAGLAALTPGCSRRRAGGVLAAGLAVALGGALFISAVPRPDLAGRTLLAISRPTEVLGGALGWRALRAWVSREPLKRPYGLQAARGHRPSGLVELVGSSPVGVLPFQLSLCLEDGVHCVPNPTLQTFAAFTPALDRRTAAHYLGSSAPDFLVVHPYELDRRLLSFDTPDTWRAIRLAYEVADRQPPGFATPASAAVLLRRRPQALELPLRPVGAATLERGSWVAAPSVRGRLVARLHLQPAPLQPLWRTLFRIPEVYVGLRTPEGLVRAVRITPSTAALGLPLDELPDGLPQLTALLRGQRTGWRTAALAIDGPGLDDYSDRIAVEWLEQLEP